MIRSKIRRVNPGRSNKLIFAVAGGLLVVLLVFFTLVIIGGRGSRGGSMARALDYLKNTEGLIAVKTMDDARQALIVFNSDSKNAGNFEKVAHYAAVRLARDWPDCEVLLARNRAEQVVYRVRVRGGAVVSEGPFAAERP
ncbi:MAG: hypothetical protein MUC72_10890 [Acidobacteria bacterium]|jgi:hypothetical protein|nr:hypothetical protein [Acidobacteriota bacterium]